MQTYNELIFNFTNHSYKVHRNASAPSLRSKETPTPGNSSVIYLKQVVLIQH
jgi:hypothetical protein